MILVVGATGQLGTAVVRRLVAMGQQVRAFVRPGSRFEHLRIPGIELAFGDLRDAASIDAACRGARTVVATANAVVPEGRSSFEAVPLTPHDRKVPLFRYKRMTEERLRQSGLSHTIFRSSLFMDDWFAFLGSRIPVRGAEAATLNRRYWFLRAFLGAIDGLIEKRGVALIPGSPTVRHAFIAVDDVAEFIVRALARDALRGETVEIGGPEILTWKDVVDSYAAVLGKPIRALGVPSTVFRVQRLLLAPFSESASNIMGLEWLVGYDTPYDATALAASLDLRLTRTGDFLRNKAALAAG
jgi:uncharacterized protein YbjT (DUF2867 family)